MLDRDTLKAMFQNALLMAFADGVLHPLQREFLQDLVTYAGIDEATARAWRAELEGGQLAFRPVRDRAKAVEVARVAIGAAAANGVFHQKEKVALLELGKALGLTRDELQALVYESFGKDVLAQLFGKREVLHVDPEVRAWVIADGMVGMEAFLEAVSALAPRVLGLREALAEPAFSGLVFFHVLEKLIDSQARLEALRRRHPSAKLVFVAERGQAYQIGYLLDGGAKGCLIAPVYPDEVEGLLERIDAKV
ncbi:MAG: hypothetical protein GXY23_08240 [Myxococcales bacterium]|nr:hypothetical protein [Myxococcales bacterium]